MDLRPYIVACVDDDPQVARRLIKGHLAFYIGGMGRYYRDLIARYGYVEETDRIADLWSKRERAQAADVVTDAMVDEICAGGTPEQARQKTGRPRGQGAGLARPLRTQRLADGDDAADRRRAGAGEVPLARAS